MFPQCLTKLLGGSPSPLRTQRAKATARPQLEPLEPRELLAAGALDVSFGNGGGVITSFNAGPLRTDVPTGVAIQSDGKIVTVGSADRGEGDRDFAVTRVHENGAPDAGFGNNGTALFSWNRGGLDDDAATCVALQADGKIVVAGFSEFTEGDYDFAVLRLNANGTLDSTFGNGGGTIVAFNRGAIDRDLVYGVAIQADGKIVLAGDSEGANSNTDMALARLNPNGTLDSSFGNGGKQIVAFDRGGLNRDTANDVTLQADGKIVAVGWLEVGSGNYDFAIIRLDVNGALDGTFGSGGRQRVSFDRGGTNDDFANDVAIQANGKIIVAGASESFGSSNYDFAVVRLKTNGALDRTFGNGGGRIIRFEKGGTNNDVVNSLALQDDGKIVLAGTVEVGGGDFDIAVVRLTKNGARDTTFGRNGKVLVNFNLGGSNIDRGNAVAIQRNRRIVVAGSVQRGEADFDFALVRLLGS